MGSDYYLDFENKFRGDREKIFNIFSSYEPLIEIAIEGKNLPILIDVGCGRGEWLQRCQKKFYKSIGIESDNYMVKICRDNGLSVIEGDAIHELSQFDNDSISVITIFHVIEHLEFHKLQKLIFECQRILQDDGVLIMETPSIDNLIVSSKTFYVDHTHINPINPDSISFLLEKSGFSNVKYYYINGGPLQDAHPLKITRIFNGVAQDLCVISTKTEIEFIKIFSNSERWLSHLNIGLSLFDAAIEYDLRFQSFINSSEIYKLNSQYNNEIIQMKEEINLLKNQTAILTSAFNKLIYLNRYFNKFIKLLYFIYKPIKKLSLLIFKSIKKCFTMIFNKIFNFLLNIDIVKNFVISENFYLILRSLSQILGNSSNSKIRQIKNELKKILDNKARFFRYNEKLLFHYKSSKKSREYLDLITKNNK